MNKIAIVILSEIETHEGLGRVVNALQTAREFKEADDDVQIIFDGGGTTAAVTLADPNDPRHQAYANVADKVAGLCRYCAKAFGVFEKAEALDLPFLSEYHQHPSLRARVADGYQIITF
ncbi:MAG: DsrE family protein [Candidatus Promineifilaceae bacterium]